MTLEVKMGDRQPGVQPPQTLLTCSCLQGNPFVKERQSCEFRGHLVQWVRASPEGPSAPLRVLS